MDYLFDLFDFVMFLIILIIYLIISIFIWHLAVKRGRSGCGWFLLSLIITPFFVTILLFIMGPTEDERLKQIEKEEEIRKRLRSDSSETSRNIQSSISVVSPPPPQTIYYLLINNTQYGPYNMAQLSQMQQNGQLTRDTLVWKTGMEQWAVARYCPELSTVFSVENYENKQTTVNSDNAENSLQNCKMENPVRTINDYYAATGATSRTETQQQKETHQTKEPVPSDLLTPSATKKGQPLILWVAISLLLISGSVAAYYFFIGSYLADKDGVRMYTFSYFNTNLRSTKIAGIDYNIIDKLPYGTQLLVYNTEQGWAQVKYNKIKGYVSSDFLLYEDDFLLLHSIFAGKNASECLSESRYRRALLNYFKSNHIYGRTVNLSDNSPYYMFQTGWQVHTQQKGTRPNTILFVNASDKNSKFQDMAVIIKKNDTNQRKCLLFAFDNNTEQSLLVYEEDAPETGYIQNVIRMPNGKYRIYYSN